MARYFAGLEIMQTKHYWRESILNLKTGGFYEQVLASSLYVTQSKEVLELQYNYGSGIDISKQKQPIASPAQTSIPVKPMPSGRRGGYK